MRNLYFLFFLIAWLACTPKKEIYGGCNHKNPIEDLEWLKQSISNMQLSGGVKGYVVMYTYNGSQVFLINNCLSCPDALVRVFDCSGSAICEFGGYAGVNSCPDFFEVATDSTMLYNGK
jgi:hypothetical protein